jgi:hypothetical protein
VVGGTPALPGFMVGGTTAAPRCLRLVVVGTAVAAAAVVGAAAAPRSSVRGCGGSIIIAGLVGSLARGITLG